MARPKAPRAASQKVEDFGASTKVEDFGASTKEGQAPVLRP